MIRFRLAPFFPVVAALAVAACGVDPPAPPEEKSATAPRLVGRVASVYRAEGFVLVENLGSLKLGQGLLLSTRGADERTATLVVSGERIGRYAAADLKSGDVAVGDAVYSRPLLAGAPSTDLELQKTQDLMDSAPLNGEDNR